MENRSEPSASLDLTTREGGVPFAPTRRRQHLTVDERIAIASYLGRGDAFDRAVADFFVAYADQTERDYAAFSAAVDSGRLVAQTGL